MSTEPLLEVTYLSKSFSVGRKRLQAVRSVSLTLQSGETLGVIGESGSGKSTLGRCLLKLQKADAGQVLFAGVDVMRMKGARLRALRRQMQMVFQDPFLALHPRMTVGRNIEDPLRIHGIGTAVERRRRVQILLGQVGLQGAHADAFPHELSGGQQQRVMIARALALDPRLLVCDEPVSSLDVSVQAQILELLRDAQRERNLSMVFISHNMAAVDYMSHQVAVMYLGEVVEHGRASSVFSSPRHPYTRALLGSMMTMPASLETRHSLAGLEGEMPSPLQMPSGCPFHPRCPVKVAQCITDKPVYRVIPTDQSGVACHLA